MANRINKEQNEQKFFIEQYSALTGFCPDPQKFGVQFKMGQNVPGTAQTIDE